MSRKGQLYMHIELEVRDKDGNLLSKHRQPAKSFVRNFLKYFRACIATTSKHRSSSSGYTEKICACSNQVAAANANALKKTDNIASDLYVTWAGIGQPIDPNSVTFGGVGALASDDSFGILIGASTQAPSVDDYTVVTKFAQGSGLNQFLHGAVTVEDVSVVGSTVYLRLMRTFTNAYSAAQTVNEIALLFKLTVDWTNGTYTALPVLAPFLMARDVLASPQVVPAGATLTVRYILSTTN